MIISLRVLGFDQNTIGINTVKSQQSFFLNLDKKHGNQNQIHKLIFDTHTHTHTHKIDEDVEILIKIKSFYETLLKSQSSKNVNGIEKSLCAITTPYLNND